jgi:hypothetical protein
MSAKGEYSVLLDLGDLLVLYPELTGEWENDKVEFTRMWEDNKDAFKDLDMEYEEIGHED